MINNMNDLKSYESKDKSLLVLDDDDIFRNRLITAMERKGFKPFGASSVAEADFVKKKCTKIRCNRFKAKRW